VPSTEDREHAVRRRAHRQGQIAYKSRQPHDGGPWFVADFMTGLLESPETGMTLDKSQGVSERAVIVASDQECSRFRHEVAAASSVDRGSTRA
jgi:hypothetical protein